MKQLRNKFGLALLTAAALLLPVSGFAKTLVVGIEPAYAPWAYVEQGEYKGITPDAVKAMGEAQGFEVEFKSLPFSSLIPALIAKKIDVVATGFTVSEKRAEKIDFTIPWWQVNMNVVVQKDGDKNLVTGLCCGAKVGVQSATTELAWLKNELQAHDVKIDVHTYEEDTTALQDLINGRVESLITDDVPALSYVDKYPDKVRLAGTIVPTPAEVYALGVRKGDTDTLSLLNQAIVQLAESGQWAEIVHRYIPNISVGDVPAYMSEDIPSYQKPIPGFDQ